MGLTSDEEYKAWWLEQPLSVRLAMSARSKMRVWPLVVRADMHYHRVDPAVTVARKSAIILATARVALATTGAINSEEPDAHQSIRSARNEGVEVSAAAAGILDRDAVLKWAYNELIHDSSDFDTLPRFNIGDEVLSSALRSAIFSDADYPGANMLERPLWGDRECPEPCALTETIREIDQLGENFSFWRRWYNAAFVGNPFSLGLQQRISKKIDYRLWQLDSPGPYTSSFGKISRAIAQIEAEYLAEKTALAEDVEINPETGKVRVVPRPLEKPELIGTILSRADDALDDALQGRNGLREDMRQVRVLRRTHARYGNDPQRIEMDYTSVAVSLRREIHETGELADTEDNLALLEAVEEGALAVRAHHPEVAENRKRFAEQKLREADPESLALLDIAEPILVEMSEDVAADDFAWDIPKLINDATTPLPSGAPPLPRADEATRIFNRSAKIKLLWEAGEFRGDIVERCNKLATKGAKVFDSNGVKTVRLVCLVSSVGGILSAVVSFGLWLFGVL